VSIIYEFLIVEVPLAALHFWTKGVGNTGRSFSALDCKVCIYVKI
jgi:hypothetical protein